jgi:tellurite resistance protein TehA-like permease
MAISSPGSGAIVMGTGIVATALAQDGSAILADTLFALAAATWLWLAASVLQRTRYDRRGLRDDAASPLALTGVAATAVLGGWLAESGASTVGVILLAAAALLWLGLIVPVLRGCSAPTSGSTLLVPVSTEALAVLCAELGRSTGAKWLVPAALAPFLAGLAFYLVAIARFDLRQLVLARGEHWIAGGALAISSMAAGRIALAAHHAHVLTGLVGALRVLGAVTWVAAIAWLPVLLTAEVLAPRPGYDVRRWSTVFPVGMYAACSFTSGAALRAPAITSFARVWVWIALAVWAGVLVAALSSRGGTRAT